MGSGGSRSAGDESSARGDGGASQPPLNGPPCPLFYNHMPPGNLVPESTLPTLASDGTVVKPPSGCYASVVPLKPRSHPRPPEPVVEETGPETAKNKKGQKDKKKNKQPPVDVLQSRAVSCCFLIAYDVDEMGRVAPTANAALVTASLTGPSAVGGGGGAGGVGGLSPSSSVSVGKGFNFSSSSLNSLRHGYPPGRPRVVIASNPPAAEPMSPESDPHVTGSPVDSVGSLSLLRRLSPPGRPMGVSPMNSTCASPPSSGRDEPLGRLTGVGSSPNHGPLATPLAAAVQNITSPEKGHDQLWATGTVSSVKSVLVHNGRMASSGDLGMLRSRTEPRRVAFKVTQLTRWCLFNDSTTHESHVELCLCVSRKTGLLLRPTPCVGEPTDSNSGGSEPSAGADAPKPKEQRLPPSKRATDCYVHVDTQPPTLAQFCDLVTEGASAVTPSASQSSLGLGGGGRAPEWLGEEEAAQLRRLQRPGAAAHVKVLRVYIVLAPGAALGVVQGQVRGYCIRTKMVPYRAKSSLVAVGRSLTATEAAAMRRAVEELVVGPDTGFTHTLAYLAPLAKTVDSGDVNGDESDEEEEGIIRVGSSVRSRWRADAAGGYSGAAGGDRVGGSPSAALSGGALVSPRGGPSGARPQAAPPLLALGPERADLPDLPVLPTPTGRPPAAQSTSLPSPGNPPWHRGLQPQDGPAPPPPPSQPESPTCSPPFHRLPTRGPTGITPRAHKEGAAQGSVAELAMSPLAAPHPAVQQRLSDGPRLRQTSAPLGLPSDLGEAAGSSPRTGTGGGGRRSRPLSAYVGGDGSMDASSTWQPQTRPHSSPTAAPPPPTAGPSSDLPEQALGSAASAPAGTPAKTAEAAALTAASGADFPLVRAVGGAWRLPNAAVPPRLHKSTEGDPPIPPSQPFLSGPTVPPAQTVVRLSDSPGLCSSDMDSISF